MPTTEPVATAEAETVEGKGCSSGNSGGRQQSTKSCENWGGGDRGGQEAPGKRREITVAAAVAVAAMAAFGVKKLFQATKSQVVLSGRLCVCDKQIQINAKNWRDS